MLLFLLLLFNYVDVAVEVVIVLFEGRMGRGGQFMLLLMLPTLEEDKFGLATVVLFTGFRFGC